MKLSRKSDYALRAMLFLASHHGGPAPVSVRQLAEENGIPRKFLEAIMRDLRELGLVDSIAGKKGGYRLARDPEHITVGEILRHFEGHLESNEPEELEESMGDPSAAVAFAQEVLRELGTEVDRLMEETTLQSVLTQGGLRRASHSDPEFAFGDGI